MTEYNAGEQRHINIARKSAKAIDEARAGFINHIMGMVDGRAYLHDLLTSCHVFAQPFSPNALVTAFALGELNIGQRVLADIMAHCPDDYIKMMREANARSITDDVRRSRSDADSNGDDRGPEPYVHPAFAGNDSAATPDSEYNPGDEDRDEV